MKELLFIEIRNIGNAVGMGLATSSGLHMSTLNSHGTSRFINLTTRLWGLGLVLFCF